MINKKDSDGLKQGYWEEKRSCGTVFTGCGEYKNGLMVGLWTFFNVNYNNNVIKYKIFYNNSLVDGDFIEYDEKGKSIISKYEFKMGEMCGLSINYKNNTKVFYL